MLLFLSDLDNTLLFSRRRRGPGDVCVEWLEGREQSFMTAGVWEKLRRLPENVRLVPVTTRSVEQYRRIRWPDEPEWAVTTNGGILLEPSGPDPAWLEASRALAEPYQAALAHADAALEGEAWCLRRRMVDGLYLFAVSEDAETAESGAAGFREAGALSVAVSGRKTYFFPPGLHKGAAAALRERVRPRRTVCAGDSLLDLPMLALADTALVPDAELAALCPGKDVRICPKEVRFSDFVLDEVETLAAEDASGQAGTP